MKTKDLEPEMTAIAFVALDINATSYYVTDDDTGE